MPLIVTDYQWKQTENSVVIQVPLHGVSSSKVDVFTSPKYLKASYAPNFFDVLLSHPVNINESKCVLLETDIIFELTKIENKLWDSLELNIPKKEKQILKNQLILEEHERYQNECKEKKERKCELKQVAVREAIQLDTKQRANIETIKTYEKNKALGDLAEWHKVEQKGKNVMKRRRIKHKKVEVDSKPCEKPIILPAIRKQTSLEVTFTKREFPTPSRESRLEEENEWLRKQAEARRSVGFDSADLRPEEKNPMYLKVKGDEFLKQKNYLGAISAYSFGIKLSNKYSDLYIGRSEAQYYQGNYHKAIEDCSTALELMKPEVATNFNERVTCISRRGMCLAKVGLMKQALLELQVALRMKPEDNSIRLALESVQQQIDNTDDSSD